MKICKKASCGCLLLLLAIVASIQVKAAEQTGSIQITLKDLSSAGGTSSRDQIEIRAYQVGSMDENDQPVWNAEYEMGEWPDNGTSMVEAAEELTKKISGEPQYQGITDQNGQCLFSNVERGIYLITIPENNAYGKIQPFLVLVPYYENVNGTMTGPTYNVQAEPKASPNEINEPEKPDNPDTSNEEPNTPGAVDTLKNSTVSATNPKTGDISNIIGYAGLTAGVFLIIIVMLAEKHRKKRNV